MSARLGVGRRGPRCLLLITDLSSFGVEETWAKLEVLSVHPRRNNLRVGVRGPGRPARELLWVAQAARDAGLAVGVHDRLDVALAAGVGVQLGERSLRPSEARQLLPTTAWIGRSCHDEEGLSAAVAEGVDAVTLSPFGPSPGKPPPLGVARFRTLVASVKTRSPDVVVFGLGGIDERNAGDVARCGADGVAVVRAWLAPKDVTQAVDRLFCAMDAWA